MFSETKAIVTAPKCDMFLGLVGCHDDECSSLLTEKDWLLVSIHGSYKLLRALLLPELIFFSDKTLFKAILWNILFTP